MPFCPGVKARPDLSPGDLVRVLYPSDDTEQTICMVISVKNRQIEPSSDWCHVLVSRKA